MVSPWRAPLEFPVQFDVNPDWRVFLLPLAAALRTGVLFGAGAARRAWKADPAMSLKGLATPVSGRRWAARDVLLPVQIALCCVLVIASLVAARGLMRSFQSPLGFKPDGAAVAGYDVALSGYDRDRGGLLHQRALEAVASMPGVESAAYASSVPLSINQSTTTVFPENTTDFRPKNAHHPAYYYVSSGFFHTVETKLLAGRDFTPQDKRRSRVVVNQTFARRVVGTADAVGRRFRWGRDELSEIIGGVGDGKYETLTESPKAASCMPILQNESSSALLVAPS